MRLRRISADCSFEVQLWQSSPSPVLACARCAFSLASFGTPGDRSGKRKGPRAISVSECEKREGLRSGRWRSGGTIKRSEHLCRRRLIKKPCRSCRTGATKRRLPIGNKTRLIGRPGKPPLKIWRPPADWSTCCIHPSDRRRGPLRLLEVFQCSSRSIASLGSKRCRSQPVKVQTFDCSTTSGNFHVSRIPETSK
jgi:hypothetical protein